MGLLFLANGMSRVVGRAHRAALDEAARYLGGLLTPEGFRLFRNGGLPLLERRHGPWRQEILLQPRPDGAGEPVDVKLHLSHDSLAALRERTSRLGRPGGCVAAGRLAELGLPPYRVAWDTADERPALRDLGARAQELALPWFEIFEDRRALWEALFGPGVPLVGHRTAIEVLLVEFGPREARAYLREVVLPHPQLGPRVERALRRVPAALSDDEAERVALAALAHGLAR